MTSDNPFSRASHQYNLWRPRYPATLFDHLASLCPSHERAWDCATGNGQAAIDLARYFLQVEATDVSAEQIAAATPSARVNYSVQAAESTKFPDAHFDLITVAQALHWFEHDRFWKEVHRVLRPKGMFAAWAYVWPQVTPAIDAIVKMKLRDVIHAYWSERNRIAWNGYRELEWPFVELPSPQIGFSCDWTCEQFLSYVRTWSATTRCIDANGDGFFAEFTEALRTVWNENAIKTVRMDFHCRLGRKG